MGISQVRLAFLLIGLTFVALALSLNLGQAILDFLTYAHNVSEYPGFAFFPS
nr:hypothetical protein [Candidatus Njordarchaeum guaymaensis]